jgi:hypothetical protein
LALQVDKAVTHFVGAEKLAKQRRLALAAAEQLTYTGPVKGDKRRRANRFGLALSFGGQ